MAGVYGGDVRVIPGTRKNNAPLVVGASGEVDALTITALTAPTTNATDIDAGASGTAGTGKGDVCVWSGT